MKPSRGRPKLETKKGKTLGIRLEEEEKALIEQAADKAGATPSEWARQILLEKARESIIV